MSNCQNCFNGCTETVSDQCVRYTGINVPTLGIQTGDPLSVIERSLTTFLVSALDGTGIKIDLNGINVCALVQAYLPNCRELSIADISKALIQAACDLQVQVDTAFSALDELNSPYTIPVDPITGPCLTDVTSSSSTHDIVQATIIKLCSVSFSLSFLIDQLPSYALKSEICTLVEECASGTSVAIKAQSKMLPYSVIPYYGPASGYPTISDGFGSTGAGYGYWENVYLCNGGNPGVPDLRGRVAVGATDMATATWPTSGQTQPGVNDNPVYGYKDPVTGIQGSNFTTLTLAQIPTHNHANSTASTIISPSSHNHTFSVQNVSTGSVGNYVQGTSQTTTGGTKTTSDVIISATTTLTILPQGQGEKHSNIQPGLAVYYLIYIPA